MIKRIIDIGEPAYLHLAYGQLLIEKRKKIVGRIPIEDIGILILQHPAIVVTQSVVVACQTNNTVLVFCDSQHLPSAITLPVNNSNSIHSKIIQEQLSVGLSRKKQLWKQIVMQKIIQQAETLKQFQKKYQGVKQLSLRVKSGDKDNCESQAAQKYWKLLFGQDFRRGSRKEGVNILLNYGYAIMRTMVARAIVGSGFHPALGLHHHNQYNSLNLADDLMEPFRPWVDRLVFQLAEKNMTEINSDTKKVLLTLPSLKVEWDGKTMPLMVSCHYLTANLKRAFQEKTVRLMYPIPSNTISC